QALRLDPLEGEVARVRHAGAVAVAPRAGDGQEAPLEAVAEGAQARRFGLQLRGGEGGRASHAHDARHDLRARAAVALLRAPAHPRAQARAAADVEHADPLRAVDLVPGEGEGVHL